MLKRARIGLGLLLLGTLGGCGSTDADPGVEVDFVFVGTASVTLEGNTYTASNRNFGVSLAPGTYEMTGSFDGAVILVFGGIESGSLESVSGPVGSVEPCGISYAAGSGGTQSLRLRFRVSASPAQRCA